MLHTSLLPAVWKTLPPRASSGCAVTWGISTVTSCRYGQKTLCKQPFNAGTIGTQQLRGQAHPTS